MGLSGFLGLAEVPVASAIRDRDPEPALLEPYTHGKAGMPVVIDHQDTTHTHLPHGAGRSMRLVSHPCKKGPVIKGRPSTRPRGRFCLANQRAISFLPQIGGLSALHRVYDRFHNLTPSDREFMRGLGTRCAVPSLTRDVRSAASDASGIVLARLLRDQAFVPCCPHLETASVDGIPCDLLRANAPHPFKPRWSRLLLPARICTTARHCRPIRECLARMIDVPRPRSRPRQKRANRNHRRRQPCEKRRAGAPGLSDRLIMRRANSCRLRRAPALAFNILYTARRRADGVRLFCQFFLPIKCARIALYLGPYALDARDRLGP
jgi:hypothetical protein